MGKEGDKNQIFFLVLLPSRERGRQEAIGNVFHLPGLNLL
ncbi:hypothetical protein MNBD_BACTEROID01-1682 [hydrothermal vent metagenome]|uniref:Uncharacterized protein n=1 Tax=hydrothermal vent metagenome TaxID=652676 RepID=A0A3B0UAL0_9ZZZZ